MTKSKSRTPREGGSEGGFQPPDGGWGWVVCLASFWVNGTIFGVINCFGVLYVKLKEKFGETHEEAAFVTWGTVGGGAPWAISKVSDMIWGVVNVVVFYFRSLLDPFTGSIDSLRSGSSSSNGRGGPPRPPGRRNIRTIADALGGSDSIPPPPPGG